MENWLCELCGWCNLPQIAVCYQCKAPRWGDGPQKCRHCGHVQSSRRSHCAKCARQLAPSRHTGGKPLPRLNQPREIKCFVPIQNYIPVHASPDSGAEMLYVIGPGDILPDAGSHDKYRKLHLPGGDIGYVAAAAGFIVDVSLGDVETPLGYVRLAPGCAAQVYAMQPDGNVQVLHTLAASDRLPVVAEMEDHFVVQLSNGFRGFVPRAYVVRILRSESLPKGQSNDGWKTALGVAGLIALGLIGSIAPSTDEEAVRKGVDRALRDRGL